MIYEFKGGNKAAENIQIAVWKVKTNIVILMLLYDSDILPLFHVISV